MKEQLIARIQYIIDNHDLAYYRTYTCILVEQSMWGFSLYFGGLKLRNYYFDNCIPNEYKTGNVINNRYENKLKEIRTKALQQLISDIRDNKIEGIL